MFTEHFGRTIIMVAGSSRQSVPGKIQQQSIILHGLNIYFHNNLKFFIIFAGMEAFEGMKRETNK
jgi:hypothetical protein